MPNGRCHRTSHPGGGSRSSLCTTVLITGVFDRGRINERNPFSHSKTVNSFKLSNSDAHVALDADSEEIVDHHDDHTR